MRWTVLPPPDGPDHVDGHRDDCPGCQFMDMVQRLLHLSSSLELAGALSRSFRLGWKWLEELECGTGRVDPWEPNADGRAAP